MKSIMKQAQQNVTIEINKNADNQRRIRHIKRLATAIVLIVTMIVLSIVLGIFDQFVGAMMAMATRPC